MLTALITLYLQRGDTIVTVDGQAANKHNVIELLIGEDTPGSFVRVGFIRDDAPEATCLLQRMSVAKIADRRRMFELFTALRDKSNLAQKSGGLWEDIVAKPKDAQKDSTALVDEVRTGFRTNTQSPMCHQSAACSCSMTKQFPFISSFAGN